MSDNPSVKEISELLRDEKFKRLSYDDRAIKLLNTITPDVYYGYRFNRRLLNKLKHNEIYRVET